MLEYSSQDLIIRKKNIFKWVSGIMFMNDTRNIKDLERDNFKELNL